MGDRRIPPDVRIQETADGVVFWRAGTWAARLGVRLDQMPDSLVELTLARLDWLIARRGTWASE